MILYGHSEAVAAFVAALLGLSRGFGNCTAIGFLSEDGALEAGIVYHNWSPENETIEISAASVNRSWCTRGRLKAIFGYPFDEIGCQAVVARIGEGNTRALRIWRALGSEEYRIPRLRGRDEAEVVMVLTEERWRGKWAAS